MSFDLYAYKELRKGVSADCEDRYDQLERRMRFPDQESQDRFDWKQSKAFIGEIEGFLAVLEDRLIEFKEVYFRGMTLTEEEMIELFYFKFTETPLLNRMDAIKDYFIDSWETLNGRNISDDDQETLQMKFDKMYKTKDIYAIYNWMLEDCGCNLLPDVPYEKRKLPYEDVFPMLYLKYRLSGGNSTHKNIKHLVIDEMQDYSYLQYTILEMLFHCRMTILGDRAQTLDTKQQDVLRFLPKLLGREIRTIEIKKSYRNTLEIARYAEKVSGVSDLELLDRHGKEVVEKTFNTDMELLDELVCHLKCPGDFETAALITTTEEEAFDLSRLLQLRGINVSYVDRNSSAFKKGLTVTTFYLAKGLEFDQVFALRGAKENPLKNQAEYICATRALHELYIYEITDSLSK
jgi:DNA helicase II / ATP-dependent DNA helicase PcrA